MVVIEDLPPYVGKVKDENYEAREKLEMIRVKFLRIARRLGHTPHNAVVAQVLHRLGLLEPMMMRGRNINAGGCYNRDASDTGRANLMAEQLDEAAGQEAPLDFSCTIMVLGKTGVGKSATINSIFDNDEVHEKLATNAFQRCTREVRDVVGSAEGIKIRLIDTPGLLPHWSDQRHNKRILTSVKHFIKKTPPDVVLYVDRLDLHSSGCGSGDRPLLRTITDVLGASVWFNKAIVVLTHAASAPADGPSGTASSYDMFVARQSHAVQQAIREAAGDMRLTIPVSLVENHHSACELNRVVLPSKMWRPRLLLVSFASKILVEAANTTLSNKSQDTHRPPFAFRLRAYPLPVLCIPLLDPIYHDLYFRVHRPCCCQSESGSKEIEADEDLLEKEEVLAPRETEFRWADSFNSANPTHLYRQPDFYFESVGSPSWRLDAITISWDWDDEVCRGGISALKSYVSNQKVRGWFQSQVLKDKKHAFLKMESLCKIKHGGCEQAGTETSLIYDMNYIKSSTKQGLLYKGGMWKNMFSWKLMTDTRFINHRRNKANAGVLMSVDADAVVAGVAVRDEIIANDQFKMLISGCAMTTPDDVIAYGGYLTALYSFSSSFLIKLYLRVTGDDGMCAIKSVIPLGRNSKMEFCATNRWVTLRYLHNRS